MAFDTDAARKTLRIRREQRRRCRNSLFEQATADARQIITMLIEKYRPARIYQWGSLLAPARFNECSDIDIALEGLSDALDGLRAIDDACKMTSLKVDLVEMERIHPEHARTIRSEGKLVYERT